MFGLRSLSLDLNYFTVGVKEWKILGSMGSQLNPGSAVEGEAQDKAQAFRSERNGPVPLGAVAGIGAMSGVLNRCERSAK